MLLATCLRQATRIRTLRADLARVRVAYARSVQANADLMVTAQGWEDRCNGWKTRAEALQTQVEVFYDLADPARIEMVRDVLESIDQMDEP